MAKFDPFQSLTASQKFLGEVSAIHNNNEETDQNNFLTPEERLELFG